MIQSMKGGVSAILLAAATSLTSLASAQAVVKPGVPRPGRTAGTEQWIVMLQDRGFDLKQRLRAIRGEAARATRESMLAAIKTEAGRDQSRVAAKVAEIGGRCEQHFWAVSAAVVEIPADSVEQLRGVPRVASLWPVQAYHPADFSVTIERASQGQATPMADTVGPANHNVDAARVIMGEPQNPYGGQGAVVAIFDSGIDRDIRHGSQYPGDQPHPAFLDNATPAQTRILAHLQAGSLSTPYADCNILTGTGVFVDSSPNVAKTGYRPPPLLGGPLGHHRACGHGTAMAAIVAGGEYSGLSGWYPGSGSGHAPGAGIVDVAFAQYSLGNATSAWVFLDSRYLQAIEALRDYILVTGGATVHVANVSIHGPSDPFHPVSIAFDRMAAEEDVLVVVCGGNFGDSSLSSNGLYHGLAVGAVHARDDDPANENLSFVPLPQSSRGPLAGSQGRYYPDLCATGGGAGCLTTSGEPFFNYPLFANNMSATWNVDGCMVMPGLDLLTAASYGGVPGPTSGDAICPIRPALGTSEAAAQVSGAATLYRGRVLTATAEETRAAILLNVIDAHVNQDGTEALPETQHTYTSRNTFGVGYLRDDLLAQFAVRQTEINPRAQVVSLTESAPVVDWTYDQLVPGDRYAVVCCWHRWIGDDSVGPPVLSNVDMQILDASTQAVLARSESPANSYERVAFIAPASSVVVRLSTQSSFPNSTIALNVQLAARRFAGDVDSTTTVSDALYSAAGQVTAHSAVLHSSCSENDKDWSVGRIVPYDWAYGSAPFRQLNYDKGFDLGLGRAAYHPTQPPQFAPYEFLTHSQFGAGYMGGAMAIAGLALRTWRPLEANDLDIEIILEEKPIYFYNAQTNPLYPLPGAGAVQVVGNTTARTIVAPPSMDPSSGGFAAAATGRDDFSVVIPFDVVFNYSGSQALHLYIRVQSETAPIFMVDGHRDGFGSTLDTHYCTWNPTTNTVEMLPPSGLIPVLGLIPDSVLQPRDLRLTSHGEPWSGPGAAYNVPCLFDVRCYIGLPNTSVTLYTGSWATPPLSVYPCAQWLGNPITPAGIATTDGFGMAIMPISIPPGLVHTELGLQAAILGSGNVVKLTNGLRVHVGGAL